MHDASDNNPNPNWSRQMKPAFTYNVTLTNCAPTVVKSINTETLDDALAAINELKKLAHKNFKLNVTRILNGSRRVGVEFHRMQYNGGWTITKSWSDGAPTFTKSDLI
jgi:hypothetical protein